MCRESIRQNGCEDADLLEQEVVVGLRWRLGLCQKIQGCFCITVEASSQLIGPVEPT